LFSIAAYEDGGGHVPRNRGGLKELKVVPNCQPTKKMEMLILPSGFRWKDSDHPSFRRN
jgi:hypothetical protein